MTARASTTPFYTPPGAREVTVDPKTGFVASEPDTTGIPPIRIALPDGIAANAPDTLQHE